MNNEENNTTPLNDVPTPTVAPPPLPQPEPLVSAPLHEAIMPPAAPPATPIPAEHQARKLPDPKQLFTKFKTLSRKGKFLVFGVIFVILLMLLMLTVPGKRVREAILPTAVPVETVAPVTTDTSNPSIYAEDAEIKAIEEKLLEFDKATNGISTREDTIRQPNLDWDVNFKE